IISLSPSDEDQVKKIAGQFNTPISIVGRVAKDKFVLSGNDQRWVDLSLLDVKEWWGSGFEKGVFKRCAG
ncbi:MAG: hypothetical protein Q7S68_02150, partial [Deltaproteobacteria bacterium]|nr:hypothetical protein [Deltaproteobacteria bacterium]